jgi:hypothetical protein
MVAKKTSKAAVNPAFVFRKEWIFDPVPPWLKLNKAALTRINQLKAEFTKQVNEQIRKGQQ